MGLMAQVADGEHATYWNRIPVVIPSGPLDIAPWLEQVADWLKDDSRPGYYTTRWVQSTATDPREHLYVFISDKNVAMEFKIRWG